MEVSKIIIVVIFRSLIYFSIISFLPLYLKERKVSVVNCSYLLFVMMFSGAIGGILGGYISDRWNRKSVISLSLFLSAFFFFLFSRTKGIISYIFLAFAGMTLLASFSVTVVLSQKILKSKAAMASGIMLGLGTGIGGLGVGFFGLLAENIGVHYAVNILVLLPLAAALLSLRIRKEPNAPPAAAKS